VLARPTESSHPLVRVSDVGFVSEPFCIFGVNNPGFAPEILLKKTFVKESGFSSAGHEKKHYRKLLIQCKQLDYARLALRLHPGGGKARGSSSSGVDV